MTSTRAGLVVFKWALAGAVLLSSLRLSAQAAPVLAIRAHDTTTVPYYLDDTVVHSAHSHLASVKPNGSSIEDKSRHIRLVKRKGHGAAKAPSHPAPHAAPAPAQHAAGPSHKHTSVAAKIRGVFHKAGQAFKKAAHAVGHFVKTTGAKIAKVGLKIVATVEKFAGKVVSKVLPMAGRVMDLASKGLNAASDHIHAKIGGKLGKAMRGMDKAQKIASFIPREIWDDEDVYMF